jgi:pimeloyl-ACP methyl ester carboxylesterase
MYPSVTCFLTETPSQGDRLSLDSVHTPLPAQRPPPPTLQVLLTSSHQGWGMASLDQDAAELSLLLRELRSSQGSQGVVLIGHSTGCQDAVRYAASYRGRDSEAAELLGIVLQAPVRGEGGRMFVLNVDCREAHIIFSLSMPYAAVPLIVHR